MLPIGLRIGISLFHSKSLWQLLVGAPLLILKFVFQYFLNYKLPTEKLALIFWAQTLSVILDQDLAHLILPRRCSDKKQSVKKILG